MRTTARHLAWRVDGFCARLNAGLAAVAIVLAGVVGATAAERVLQQLPDRPGFAQMVTGADPADTDPVLEIP
jgi:hypothetical protein